MEPAYVVNVEIVLRRGDMYLLTRRSLQEEVAPGMLSFPGGKVEGELPGLNILEDTGARELVEETGTSASWFEYVASTLFVTPSGQAVVDIIFAAEYSHGSATVCDCDELESVFWICEQDLLAIPDLPSWTRTAFELARDRVFLHK